VKTLHIPMYILDFFNLEHIELLEYIIAGIFGLVSRLGFRGIIEAIFVDNYATMGGEDPTQGSSFPVKTGGVATTNTSDEGLQEKGKQIGGSGSSAGNRQLESESSRSPEDSKTQKGGESSSGVDTQGTGKSSSENYSVGKHVAERYTKIYDNIIKDLVKEVKALSFSMDETKDDEEWKKMKEMFDTNMEQIQMINEEAAKELKKLVSSDTNSSATKRDLADVDKEEKGGRAC